MIYLLPFAADLDVWGKYIVNCKKPLEISVTVYVSKPQYYRARKCLNFGTEDSIDQILLLQFFTLFGVAYVRFWQIVLL